MSDSLCFLHIKVSLGPREICEEACHLTTDKQHGNRYQNFYYLDSVQMLWVYINSLIWKAKVHTVSLQLYIGEALNSSTKEETWKTKYVQRDRNEEKKMQK